jgi:hypothetical protein
MGLAGNALLAGMSFVVVALQLFVLYIPTVSAFFNVKPLSAIDLLVAVGTGALVFVAMEVEKLVMSRKK